MLPYKTIQEAEAALGRALTAAETVWFNYTADKSDYFLYCHNILFLFLIFSCVPLYYLFLEFFFRNSVQSYKIQPKVKLSFSDKFNCYKSVMRMFILVVGPLQLVSYPSIKVMIFSICPFLTFFILLCGFLFLNQCMEHRAILWLTLLEFCTSDDFDCGFFANVDDWDQN